MANQDIFDKLYDASIKYKHKVFVPCGAFWASTDVKKMANLKILNGLSIAMKKHPDSLKLEAPLKEKLESYSKDEANLNPCILYEGIKLSQIFYIQLKVLIFLGPVRGICDLAPNNVNTMAIGALSAHNLGFDNVIACLVADKK